MTDRKKVYDAVIVGLGKTGLSCARYLQGKGKRFAITDNRDLPPQLAQFQSEFADITLSKGRFDQQMLLQTEQILLSPGVSSQLPEIQAAVKAGIPLCNDVEIFCQNVQAPIVAVTGSNGKSTVVTLFKQMAEASGRHVQLGGNIGTPVLDLLEQEQADLYVLELSSFQLELTSSLNAAAAVVLNVSEDHMDRYSDLADYAETKAGIYAGDGVMVINRDDPCVVSMQQQDRNTFFFTGAKPATDQYGLESIEDRLYLMKGDEPLIDTNEIKIRGEHNYLNVLAALALGEAIGLPLQGMLRAIKSFSGLPHRCEFIGSLNTVDWYNDSKGTNVGASCRAIESLAGKNNLVLIAGGMGKGADFSPMKSSMMNRVKLLVTLGVDGAQIAKQVQGVIETRAADTLEMAVQIAYQTAQPGDVVLLSPACASQDMFADYADRGQCFVDAARAIGVKA